MDLLAKAGSVITKRPKPSPDEYLKHQEKLNLCHLDGRVELPEEFDAALSYGEWLEERLGEPSSVLIIGCRTGYEVRAFAGLFDSAQIVGMDLVSTFLGIAQAQGAKNLLQADMHKLPFADRSFDWCYSMGTLEHAHDPQQVVDEMCRVASTIYLTADLDEDSANPSHYSFSTTQQDWVKLFPPAFQTEHFKRDNSVHILARS